MPCAVAKEKGNAQYNLLMQICTEAGDVNELNLNELMEKVNSL